MRAARAPAALALAALALAGCGGTPTTSTTVPGGDPALGRQLIRFYGCVACHVIGGLAGAQGHVGPPLTRFRSKSSIAGRLPNTPAAVAHWIESPQGVLPGNLMPDLGVDPSQARDIAAYLYTQ